MLTMKSVVSRLGVDQPDISADHVKEAKRVYAEFREGEGFKKVATPLLTAPANNYKMAKGDVLNYGLSLAPARVSGVANVCHMSTIGCRDLCINTAGNGLIPAVQQARISKTVFMLDHPNEFFTLLMKEIEEAKTEADTLKKKMAVRLNVFSDIPWELAAPWLFTAFPGVQFYDYTKDDTRFGTLPANYHLTFSASERTSDSMLERLLDNQINVTIVADKVDGQVPVTWNNFPVLDGDITDFRPSDPNGVVVFLKPKGRARNKTTAPRGKFIRSAEGFAVPEKKEMTA
jgi:hypothetical protein